MGYYTGSGVVVSGSNSESIKETLYWVTHHTIYQKNVSSTNVKNGVNLTTAQASSGSMNLANKKFENSGGSWFVIIAADGTTTTANYSRIGDSNLYTLSVTTSTLSCRDSAGWSKGGV